jgi:hypothetical protein
MFTPELVEEFPQRSAPVLGYIFKPLTDSFVHVGPRRDVEQALIRFRILHDSCGLTVDRQNNRAFSFFQLPKKRRGIVPKRRQSLNVLRNVHL